MRFLPIILAAIGLGLIVAGVGLVFVPLALVLAGVGLLGAGLLFDPDRKARR